MTLERIDLLNKKFGNKVVFYDMVGKYGDWLFKQPIILSFVSVGYIVSFWRKNFFRPHRLWNEEKHVFDRRAGSSQEGVLGSRTKGPGEKVFENNLKVLLSAVLTATFPTSTLAWRVRRNSFRSRLIA